MIPILVHQAVELFSSGRVSAVRVVEQSANSWILVFDGTSLEGDERTYTIRAQRGWTREWSDPRKLFRFLNDRLGVRSGQFILAENDNAEHQQDEGS